MILIVSSPKDGHATEVMGRLEAKGTSARLLDLSDFPSRAQLSIEFNDESCARSRMTNGSARTEFDECRVVWWRRPQPFSMHEDLRGATDGNFAYSECHAAVSGLWLTLDAHWINHPTRDEEAARKVHQLKVARQLGLTIPETCITNDPDEAHRFVSRRGFDEAIYKAFSGTEQAWRETRLLKRDELAQLDQVRYAPVIFQEYVPAEVDLRITVVGDQVFACAIDTRDTEYQVDFRMVMDKAEMCAYELPEELRDRLVAYVRRLGLVYGAIDMRLKPNGEFVFLEINPAGQWLFVEHRTGLPITEALIDVMIENDS